MDKRVTLAVVIPTYGRVDSVRRLLESIAAQSIAPSEVIVVDQNCDDLLADVVPPHAQHVRLDEANAAAARNAGFLLSRATHVTFIDDDEILEAGHVERLVRIFESHRDVRCVWPVVHDGVKARALRAIRRKTLPGTIPGSDLFRISRPGSGGIAFDRELFQSLGGYDDVLFRYARTGEDWELSARMRERNVAVWCDPQLMVEHASETAGGCAIRSVPCHEARRRFTRGTLVGRRIRSGPTFRLRLRDVGSIVRYGFLSSLGRNGARLDIVAHPLRHLRMLVETIRESKAYVLAHAGRYSGRVNHLDHAPRPMAVETAEDRPRVVASAP